MIENRDGIVETPAQLNYISRLLNLSNNNINNKTCSFTSNNSNYFFDIDFQLIPNLIQIDLFSFIFGMLVVVLMLCLKKIKI